MRIKKVNKGSEYMQFVVDVTGCKGKTLTEAYKLATLQHQVIPVNQLAPYPTIVEAIKVKPKVRHDRFAFNPVKPEELEARRSSAERLYRDAEQYLLDIAKLENEEKELS